MRNFRFFFATLLLLALAIPNAFSQTSVWNGSAVSWTHGTGTQADPYLIESAQNLAYIAEMVNGGVNQYEGIYFKQIVDIDLDSLEWTPIGNYNTTSAIFKGNFDGDNHSIDKLKINSSTLQYGGLFGRVNSSMFRNINVGGRIVSTHSSSYMGAISGYTTGSVTLENCNSSVYVSSTYYAGGLIGYGSSTVHISNCSSYGDVLSSSSSSSSSSYSGGLFGYGSCTVTNCSNYGDVSSSLSSSSSSSSNSGGLVGYGSCTVTNCSNYGDVSSSLSSSSSSSSYSGGLVGRGYGTVTNCSNYGDVSSKTSTGGLVGYVNNTVTVTNCSNYGDVSVSGSTSSLSAISKYSGGIIGYGATVTISNCSNSGSVSSSLSSTSAGTLSSSGETIECNSSSGGIVGFINTQATITQCVNIGNVSSSASTKGKGYSNTILLRAYSYCGGIVGYSGALSSNLTMSLCYNKGAMSSTASNSAATNYSRAYSYSGGLLGCGANSSYNTINNSYNRGNVTATAEKTAGSSYSSNAMEYASGIGYSCKSTNCYNTGTLTAPYTSYCSIVNKFGIGSGTASNCYYLETCGHNAGSNGTSKTEEAMKSESFPVVLNSEVFTMDVTPNVNDGYPIFGANLYIITGDATNLDFTSATLNGSYFAGTSYPNPADMQGFEWKEASASEWTTVYTNVGTPASYNLTGLTIGTTYNYRLFLKYGDVTYYGNTVDFTTRACDAAVSLTADNTTFCSNLNTVINASPSSSGSISSYSWSTGESGTAITAGMAGTYTVTVADEFNCTASASIDIATIPAPTAGISGNTYICTGNSTTLTASGGVGYVWSTGATTPSINVSETGEYYVIARASNNCTDTAYITVANFNEVVISGNTTICAGGNTTLSVSEGNSYLWSTGATTRSITVTNEGLYSVTVTNAQCEANTSVYVTVNTLPTPVITGTTAICGGASTTLTATGGTGYVWNNGATTASNIVSTSGNYRVTVTNANGCTASASTSVVSAPNPSVQITGNTTACEGTQIALTATGGSSYSWSNSANTATINPTQSGAYTVTAYNDLGCFATASAIVTINPNPQLNITAPHTICNNSSTTLEVSDNLGSTITSCVWSNGGSGTSIQVSPAATTNYTVTVTNNNGCMAQASTSVIVAEQLSLAVSGNTSICGNESAELTVSGIAPTNVNSYAWSNGANTASVFVSAAGTYSVIVTDVNGCTGYATTNVSAAENPVASISGQQSVCSGSSATLLASGGTSYQWSDGSTDASISVTTGGTYTVVVTNGAGCTAIASAIVTVNESPMPQISGELAMCEGSNTTLTVTGGDSFVWSNGSTSASVNVTNAGTYTVIASNANGCTASASAVVSFMENPLVTISGNPSICAGGVTTLTAEGGNSYLWSTGFPGASINVNAAGTYSVIATGTNGCTSSASMTVAQYSAPEVSITGNATVCEGSSTTITANGGVSYQWSTGETGASISVNAFGIYSVTATGNGGCTATANATVFVASAPTPSINGNLHICDNEATTLTANGGDSYMWSNGSTGNSINVTNGGTYSVIATNASGCTAMASANVEAGYSVTNSITETAETEYIWNGQTYTATGDYTQSFIAANGCDSIVTLHLTITGGQQVQHYNIFVVSSNSAYGTVTGTGVYEENEVVTITATANEGYEFLSWNDGNTESIRQIVVTGDATYIATFIPATGIQENVALEIALFPNPVTDILNITSSEPISEIEIVNVMGQVVRRVEVNSDNAVCNVEDLTSGVYVVRIRTASATLSQQRFVKE